MKTEELSTISTTNLSNTLAGRAPGLTIVGSSGFMGLVLKSVCVVASEIRCLLLMGLLGIRLHLMLLSQMK